MAQKTTIQEDGVIKLPDDIVRKTGVLSEMEMIVEGDPSGTITMRPKVQRRDFCQSCFKTISTINWSGIRICRECYTKLTGRIWVDPTPEEIERIIKGEPARLRYYILFDQIREVDEIERLYGESLPYDELYWFLRIRDRTPIAMIHGDHTDLYEELIPSLENREKTRIAALEAFSDKYRLDLRGARERDSFGIATHLNWRLSNDEFLELRKIMGGKA